MANATLDLWPDKLGDTDEEPSFLVILNDQAELLGKKLDNVIEGKVETATQGDKFFHNFYLVVPSLDNYYFLLLTVSHKAFIYPLEVWSSYDGFVRECQNEATYIDGLREILNASDTKKIVNSLLAQAKAA